MKWLEYYRLGKKRSQEHEKDEIAFRNGYMQAAVRTSATQALGHLLAVRSLSDYKKAIKQAEKANEKYSTLAELLVKMEVKLGYKQYLEERHDQAAKQ